MNMTFDRALGSAMLAAEEMGYRISAEEFFSERRDRKYVIIRMAVCYLLREHSRMTTVAIGKAMGRCHATVIHASQQAKNLMMNDAVTGNLIFRACRLSGVEAPDGLCLSEPYVTCKGPFKAKDDNPGAVRIDQWTWRLLRPWAGETAESIMSWGSKKPSEPKVRPSEEGGYVVPLHWTKKERRKLNQWREQTRGSIGPMSPSTVGFGGSGKVGSKTPKAHRQ